MYATALDMLAQYNERSLVQLTDAVDWAAAIAPIERRLAIVAPLVQGYVAKFYAPAPGRPVPAMLTRIACQIAYCELAEVPTDDAKAQKAEAIRTLEQIAKGHVKLDDGSEQLPARDGAIIVPDTPRTFSRGALDGF